MFFIRSDIEDASTQDEFIIIKTEIEDSINRQIDLFEQQLTICDTTGSDRESSRLKLTSTAVKLQYLYKVMINSFDFYNMNMLCLFIILHTF